VNRKTKNSKTSPVHSFFFGQLSTVHGQHSFHVNYLEKGILFTLINWYYIMFESRLLNWLSAGMKKICQGRESKLEKELIRLTRKDVAQRLIELEQEKNPTASRQVCIDNALIHLKRDRD